MGQYSGGCKVDRLFYGRDAELLFVFERLNAIPMDISNTRILSLSLFSILFHLTQDCVLLLPVF